MALAPVPGSLGVVDETDRLAALEDCGILDTEPEEGFDNIVRLAATLFDVPMALISLVDADRQWFKAQVGTDLRQTVREIAFCAHTILTDNVFVVPNAEQDRLFAANPLVTEAGIRFYAGAPLRLGSGHRLGALCILDEKPRPDLGVKDRRILAGLAQIASDRIEASRIERTRCMTRSRFEKMLDASPIAAVCADGRRRIVSWNDAATALFGHTAEQTLGQPLEMIVPERFRAAHNDGVGRAAASGQAPLTGTAIEIVGLHRNGEEIPIEISLSMWHEDGQPAFGAIMRDITDRHRAQERLHRLAHYDPLTGLPNRHSFQERAQVAIACPDGVEPTPTTLLLLDLDGFKDVNDSLGHSAGDRLLSEAAHRLERTVGEAGLVARVGGDEFAILLEQVGDPLIAAEIAQRIVDSIAEPFQINGQLSHLSASIGIALYPAHGRDAEQLLSNADLALYRAKSEGGSDYQFFAPKMAQNVQARLTMENELRQALSNHQLELFFQPQVRLKDNEIIGAEALLRWRHPKRGLLAPATFLSIIENGPLAAEVGDWVITEACQQAAYWQAVGLPGLRVGVNLFGTQFRNGRLVDFVQQALAESGLPADQLELEITENIVLRRDESLTDLLEALRALGVGIALDDFGTGFASLSLLKRFPLNRLKIDRSFVRGVAEDSSDRAIVGAVLAMAQSLALEVVAEGIETHLQAQHLTTLRCAEGQGFLYGAPMRAPDFIDLVLRRQRGAA